MTPETQRIGGALAITPEQYDATDGEEFKGKIGKVNEQMSREDVKTHPVWKILARDQALLNDYVDHIFAEGKERFGYDTAMGVFPIHAQSNMPEMRAWYVGRLENSSNVYGTSNLGNGGGRLVGVAPEAQHVAQGSGAGNVKTYTMADLQAVDEVMKGLEGTLHPDVLKPFSDLRKKL